jgi:hypothetical protein
MIQSFNADAINNPRIRSATAMCCHSVGCGTPGRMQSAMRLDTQHYSRSHNAVIRVYDGAGNVIETHEHRRFQRVVRVYHVKQE